MHLYKVVTVFGSNIVASEGEEWKKYRKKVQKDWRSGLRGGMF
jgi:predicted phosphohydrolase